MKLIIEDNCSVPSKSELELVTPILKRYIESIVEAYQLDALEYFVIADSKQNSFNETVQKYAAIIGTNTSVTNNEGYQTAAKSIDGLDENGVYRQAIILKGMIWTQSVCDLMRLIDELPQQLAEQTDSVKYISLTTIIHELGHAVDNLYQFRRDGYCDDQIAFDLLLPEEYKKYIDESVLSIWGEYFAERFCYSILGPKVRTGADESMMDCIKTYSKGSLSNQITERVYMILYFFVRQLGYLHQMGENFDFSPLKEDEEARAYIPFLKTIEELVKTIYLGLPEWDECVVGDFAEIYHNLLRFEGEKQKW